MKSMTFPMMIPEHTTEWDEENCQLFHSDIEDILTDFEGFELKLKKPQSRSDAFIKSVPSCTDHSKKVLTWKKICQLEITTISFRIPYVTHFQIRNQVFSYLSVVKKLWESSLVEVFY